MGFPLALTQTLQVLESSCSPHQIFNFSSNLLTRYEKTAKEFVQLPKPTRNTRKISNKSMTVASGELNLQSERSHLSRSESEPALQGQRIPWLMLFF